MAAVDEWAETMMSDHEDAMETKVEQALLEIEHLAAGATEVEFEVDPEAATVTYEPTPELADLLGKGAAETGLAPDEVLRLHVDLFARVFLDDERPSNAPSV